MAEAEEVITDAAWHATVYAQELWRRHRKIPASHNAVALRDIANRLDLLLTAVFGKTFPLRVAQPPPPETFLTKVFYRRHGPRATHALPTTDGHAIYLPATLAELDRQRAVEWYRLFALQQAMRSVRKGVDLFPCFQSELERDIFMLLEARAADAEILRTLPGMRGTMETFLTAVLERRPALEAFPAYRRPLEAFVRQFYCIDNLVPSHTTAEESMEAAKAAALSIGDSAAVPRSLLFRDLWTGGRLVEPVVSVPMSDCDRGEDEPSQKITRSARLARRPSVRASTEDEDDKKQGAWMVQTSQPHEQVEDPSGLQRPTDRDEATAAEDFADALSELPEARLVSTPGRPKEVLLSDDLSPARKTIQQKSVSTSGVALHYPEWDWRLKAYREPGATVHVSVAEQGKQEWVDRAVQDNRLMLQQVRRHFEMLRAQRVRLRKQYEGDEIDLEAYIDCVSDYKAGLPMAQAVYQSHRLAKRDMAITLLMDISGSTDGWISGNRRVIDVERDALLLVCIALQGMNEPYSVLAFSGEGPRSVSVKTVKEFGEKYTDVIARRIASLEPELYTRTGAGVRHASSMLMSQTARHRLLLLLSDGKPNDIDEYEGRYGVEDMRQAVTEARLQGIHVFCLTIDRQAANYLPNVFGPHGYGLLPKAETLPTVLLEWIKRLVVA